MQGVRRHLPLLLLLALPHSAIEQEGVPGGALVCTRPTERWLRLQHLRPIVGQATALPPRPPVQLRDLRGLLPQGTGHRCRVTPKTMMLHFISLDQYQLPNNSCPSIILVEGHSSKPSSNRSSSMNSTFTRKLVPFRYWLTISMTRAELCLDMTMWVTSSVRSVTSLYPRMRRHTLSSIVSPL